MKSILCVDLDYTLLEWPEDGFIEVHANSISKFLGRNLTGEWKDQLFSSIQKIAHKNSPEHTLEHVFIQEFLSASNFQYQQILTAFQCYYQIEYPFLRSFTQQNLEAKQFVIEAIRRGHKVVIATNPIFPKSAVLERLRWAGLEEYIPRFEFITNLEEFHFAKPNPEYFCEIQGKLGWPEHSPVVMVGDSLKNDIIPASRSGMPAYWLSDRDLPVELDDYCQAGSFSGLFDWLEWIEHQPIKTISSMKNPDILAHLRTTPALIDSICDHVPDQIWQIRPDENEWSLVEILCHLRDADRDVNFPRFKEAFETENPFLPSIDTDSWRMDRNYLEENGSQVFQEFLAIRADLVDLLDSYPGKWWQRTARHSVFGPTCLAELLMFLFTHDQMHVKQMRKTLEKIRFSTKV